MTRHWPGYREARAASRFIFQRSKLVPRVGIILGSGLGGVTDRLRSARSVPYPAIPHFPRSTVKGHAGRLCLGMWGEAAVAVLEGRTHLYEGYTPAEVVLPVRALGLAGVECLIVTCAAGGIAPRAVPGSFMLFRDHLNYQGMNPLVGPEDDRLGPRFIDMSQAYDAELRHIARRVAARLKLRTFEGVYAALLGPSFETPAEIQALKRLGADAVGMSTVPEVIAARQLGMRVLAVASISNRAAGLSHHPLSHQEVLETGRQTAQNLAALLEGVVTGVGAATSLRPRRAGKNPQDQP